VCLWCVWLCVCVCECGSVCVCVCDSYISEDGQKLKYWHTFTTEEKICLSPLEPDGNYSFHEVLI